MPTNPTRNLRRAITALSAATKTISEALTVLDKTLAEPPEKKPTTTQINTRLTPQLLKRVSRLHARRLNDVAIAKALGVRPATVKYARSHLGLGGYSGNPALRRG